MSAAAPSGGRDPGLQPERTVLAWSRTGLSVVTGSLLAARLLAPQRGGAGLALGAAGVLLGLLLLVAAPLRERRAAPGRRPAAGLLAAVAAGCFLLGAAGAVVVLVPTP